MAPTDFVTAIKDPNAWLSQHLSLTVAGVKSPISVFEITINEEMNALPELDVLIASDDQTLDGADFLGKNATLVIEERAALKYSGTASRHARTMHGVAMEWEHRSSSNDEAKFWLRVKPRVALLGLQTYSEVFLNRTLKEIFYELLVDRERIWPHDIELNFEGLDQRHEQILTVDESPINFFKRLCLLHGLYFYFKYADVTSKTHRDTLVVDNRPNGYMRSIDVPFVPANGLSGKFHEAVLSIKRKQTLMSQSVGLRDHNYRTPDAPVTALAYVDRGDKTLFGSIDRSNEHFHTKEEGQALTTVRAEAIDSRRHVHSGTTNIIGLYPGWVLNTTNHKLPKAPYGLVISKVKTTGSRTKPVTNEFEGTPADKTWRPDFVPERDWRWMEGSLIATIESSMEGSPYADLDEHGRYLVRFHFHTRAGKPGSNSMRLRLMTPSASKDGGFHAPLLPGTEVRIFFTNGDIDRAYIGAAVHDYSRANHVHGYQGWNSRAVWRSPLLSGKVRFEDFKGKEGAKFATTYMQTSVSMGYLVDTQKRKRGEGLEAFTKKHLAMRAGTGMFLVVDRQADPNKPQLEMQQTKMQLDAAVSQMQSLADLACAAQALTADVERQRQMLSERIDGLKQAVLLASAPDGIALTSGQHLQFSAQADIASIAGGNADYGAMRTLTFAAGEGASMYANQGPLSTLLPVVLNPVDRLLTTLFVVLRPVDRLLTVLLVLLRPVESELMPVEVDTESEFRFVDSELTVLFVVLRPVDKLLTELLVLLRPVDKLLTALFVVLKPVENELTTVERLLTVLLVVLRPVERLSTLLLVVLTPVERLSTLLLVVLTPVERLFTVVDNELTALFVVLMPVDRLLTVLVTVLMPVERLLTALLVVDSPVERLLTALFVVLKPVESEERPVEVDTDSELRPVDRLLTVLVTVLMPVDRELTALLVVLSPVDRLLTLLLAVLRPVDRLSTLLDVVLTVVEREFTVLFVVLKPVDSELMPVDVDTGQPRPLTSQPAPSLSGERPRKGLGGGYVLGRRLAYRSRAVRVTLRPDNAQQAHDLLPGAWLHRELMAFVQLYVGIKADVHLRMQVSSRVAPVPTIGTAAVGPAPRLGWTTVLPAEHERLITIPLGIREAFPAPAPNPYLSQVRT